MSAEFENREQVNPVIKTDSSSADDPQNEVVSASPPMVEAITPDDFQTHGFVVVKVYGLIGHTRCIDLQFDKGALTPERIFVFDGKRYKIASVVQVTEEQLAINAVSIEYRT